MRKTILLILVGLSPYRPVLVISYISVMVERLGVGTASELAVNIELHPIPTTSDNIAHIFIHFYTRL